MSGDTRHVCRDIKDDRVLRTPVDSSIEAKHGVRSGGGGPGHHHSTRGIGDQNKQSMNSTSVRWRYRVDDGVEEVPLQKSASEDASEAIVRGTRLSHQGANLTSGPSSRAKNKLELLGAPW